MMLLVLGAPLLLWPNLFWADFRMLRVDFIERGNHTIMVRVCNPTLRWVFYNASFSDNIDKHTPYGTSLQYKRRLDDDYVYLKDAFVNRSGFTYVIMYGELAPFTCISREAEVDWVLRREEEIKIHDPDNLIEKYRLEFRIPGGVPTIDIGPNFLLTPKPHSDGSEKKFYSPWYDYSPSEERPK